ncbi:hypothetical protein CJ199_02100 [Brevibacterium paucivorans]|uniref:Uncharacterized protein n=1 Tax=Brevibacterium paucivorans TaxID=170994 RepID=A0A2N6VPZ3_9MICO|nr:hypothetical protein CJ199_02100 [Brevibacterium paucivorans]
MGGDGCGGRHRVPEGDERVAHVQDEPAGPQPSGTRRQRKRLPFARGGLRTLAAPTAVCASGGASCAVQRGSTRVLAPSESPAGQVSTSLPLGPQCEASGHHALDAPRFFVFWGVVGSGHRSPFLVRNPVTHYTRVVLNLLCWVNEVGACGDVADLRWRKAERCGGDGLRTDSAKRTVRRIVLRSLAHFAPI